MNHKRPPIPLIIILILAILVGGYFGIRSFLNKGTSALTASGTIEAIQVTISPEVGGKVADVTVDEGAMVKAGDVLFHLDDALLQAQRVVAVSSMDLAQASATTADASLATAQANYILALNTAHLESAGSRTSDWRAANPAGYTLPGGYFTASDEIASAQTEVDAARSARDSDQEHLNTLLADPANASFKAAEIRLEDVLASYLVAQDVLARALTANNSDLRDAAQTSRDDARTALDDAQAAYDALKDTDAAQNIILARVDLAVAQERFEAAQDHLLALQTGLNSPKLAAAQAVLRQASAAADQSHLAVTQSQANLALLDVQIARLTIKAPSDGSILMRAIQPGETVSPGASAMIMSDLTKLTITVYVPENLYGEISLGQSASMAVDSFPSEVFNATVIHIANQAEFTPRNVQTAEGRSSTVYAIKLQVHDPNGKLKPGMPADVIFGPTQK